MSTELAPTNKNEVVHTQTADELLRIQKFVSLTQNILI